MSPTTRELFHILKMFKSEKLAAKCSLEEYQLGRIQLARLYRGLRLAGMIGGKRIATKTIPKQSFKPLPPFNPTSLGINSMKFKELTIGERFIFESEISRSNSGMMLGPWIKVSNRKYHLADDIDFECEVGTTNVEVIKQR